MRALVRGAEACRTVSALAAKLAERTSKHRELKTLVFDIERTPGQATVTHRGLTVTGSFWDMGSWKYTIGRRINPAEVTAWPQTLCVDATWLGSKEHIFTAAWDDRDEMARTVRTLLDEADIVVGYNSKAFDEKHVASDMIESGLAPPSPYRSIDLYSVVRQRFGFESKKLGSVLDRLSMPSKNDVYDPTLAWATLDGDVKAQKRMQRYCRGDVEVTAALYWRLLPWIKTHPHVAPNRGLDHTTCPRCSSQDVKRDGTWSAGVHRYLAYRCNTCTGYFRTTFEAAGPSVRAL